MGPLPMALYHWVVIPTLRAALFLASPFHEKIKRRRRDEAEARNRAALELTSDRRLRVWFHAASMGELEQLVPVIERLRRLRGDLCIVSTCTSPSGRDHAQRQPCIDHALYLPLDSPKAMKRFIAVIDPVLVVIDRYDLWPTMVSSLRRRDIPVMLINATAPSSARLPLLRGFTRRLYSMMTSITAVTSEDARALQDLVGLRVEWRPDTRMDRVMERVELAAKHRPVLPDWTGKTLVMGSSWPDDESLLLTAWNTADRPDWRLIIVPHEPTESALVSIEHQVPCVRLSAVVSGNRATQTPHILVDSVGHLLEIYSIATAAYVGGGFGAGVHSLAEPAGFGLPIACGPRIERSRDAAGLLEHAALAILTTPDDCRQWLANLNDAGFRESARTCATRFVEERRGSSDAYAAMIIEQIDRSRSIA